MPNYPGESTPSGMPRPGKVVLTTMCVVSGLCLAFAVGEHWASVGPEAFLLFCGNTLLILHGQVWRLLTAPLLQSPDNLWQLFGVLITLYFFGVPLEEKWGARRFLRFLLGAALVSTLAQALFDVALPPGIGRYLAQPYWFGGSAVAGSLAVAWALNHQGQVVRLYGVLPISTRTIILMVIGVPFIYLVFRSVPTEGFAADLGGALAGWLLGGGTPSPIRRLWLKFRISRLDAEVEREALQRKRRVERSRLKVIEGGLAKGDPAASENGEKGRGPDGRWLN
jgi:membrane associated rhomboid family serine protease